MNPTESQLRENYAAKDTKELLELRARDSLTELARRMLDEVLASRSLIEDEVQVQDPQTCSVSQCPMETPLPLPPRYRSTSLLVNIMSACFVLYGVSSVFMGLSSFIMLSSLKPGLTENVESVYPWLPFDTTNSLDSFLFIALVILFSAWVYRVNSNARALGAQGMRFSPRWAVGWFFVPIMNLFRPYQVVREAWKASDPKVLTQWDQIKTPLLLKAWWVMWLLSIVRPFIETPLITPELIKFLMVYSAIIMLAHVGNCILGFLLVQNMRQRQETRFTLVQSNGRVANPLFTVSR